MSGPWIVETLAGGSGVIERRTAPRFRALWTSGLDDLAGLEGLFWTDEGCGEDDALTLHGFRWEDAPPAQDRFEALMREAAAEIDAWIARRL